MPCACDEVVEDVLFSSKVASPVPVFPVLSTTTEIRDCDDAALVQPCSSSHSEVGLDADSVSPVTSQYCRIGAVEFHSFTSDDVERDLGTIVRRCELSHYFAVAKIGRR